MIVRADGGSPERWHAGRMHQGVRFPWEAYFTPGGRDFCAIHTMLARDRDGVLLSDVVGNIRA
jgi:hypothetical protein